MTLKERIDQLVQQQEPVSWKHDCAGLCTNDVELGIDACPHCGKPRTAQPAPAAVPLTDEKIDHTLATTLDEFARTTRGMSHALDVNADITANSRLRRMFARAVLAAQPADAQPTGQSPCARHCEAPAFEGEIRRLKRELQTQAERIRVLREALEQAKNGLGWWQESCPELVTECDHEAMAQIDAALEATK